MGLRIAMEHTDHFSPGQIYVPLLRKWLEEELLRKLKARVDILRHRQILEGRLRSYDVVIFPGGGGSLLAPTFRGEEFIKRVRNFVADGGGFVGSCGGAYAACAKIVGPTRQSLITKFRKALFYSAKEIFGGAPSGMSAPFNTLGLANVVAYWPNILKFMSTGTAELLSLKGIPIPYRLANFEVSKIPHPIIQGHEGESIRITYTGGAIMDRIPQESTAPEVIPLIFFGENSLLPKAYGKLAAVCTTYGGGRVVLCGPHPELPPIFQPPYLKTSQPWFYKRMIMWAAGIEEIS